MVDMKRVNKANNKDLAEQELDILSNKRNDKYPIVIKTWRDNWDRLSQCFKYPEDIRRIIYTTNTIEAVHRQFRKLTKTIFWTTPPPDFYCIQSPSLCLPA